MAGVGHLERGQLLDVGVDGGGEAPEQAGPVPGRHGPPGLEGGGGPCDGGVGLLGGQALDGGDDLAGGWVADVHAVIFADGAAEADNRGPGAGPPVQCGAVPAPPRSQRARPVQFNLAKAFDTLVETLADRECIVWRDRRLTYGEVSERSRRLASYLHGRGLGVHRERAELRGWESGQDHVALALYNGNEYLEGMLGLVPGPGRPRST